MNSKRNKEIFLFSSLLDEKNYDKRFDLILTILNLQIYIFLTPTLIYMNTNLTQVCFLNIEYTSYTR